MPPLGAGLVGWLTLPGSTALVVGGGLTGGGGGGGVTRIGAVVALGAPETPLEPLYWELTTVQVIPTARSTSPATITRTMRRRFDEPSNSGSSSASSTPWWLEGSSSAGTGRGALEGAWYCGAGGGRGADCGGRGAEGGGVCSGGAEIRGGAITTGPITA